MGEKRAYFHRVEPHDVDMTLHATLASLGNYVLHTAGEDADRNGFGLRDLGCKNASWVLSRMALEFSRRPQEYERFCVTTWVNEVGRATTTRNFDLIGEDGSPFGGGVTIWAVIDLDSRHAVDLRGVIDYDGVLCGSPSPITPPRRLSPPDCVRAERHSVRYGDIDFNGHVHSTKYLEWALDMLPLDVLTGDRIGRIDINYLKEARYGSLLKIHTDDACEPVFQISADDDAPLCRIGFCNRN